MPLPQLRPTPFDHPDWIFEPKHDGFRCIAYVEYGRCRLVSRNGNEFKSFSLLKAAIADELKGHSAVIQAGRALTAEVASGGSGAVAKEFKCNLKLR